MPVTVTVNANTSQAEQKLAQFFAHTAEGLEHLSGFGEFFREWGAQIASAISVGALVEFAREAINTAEGIKILSQQTGISIETLAKLREAATKLPGGFESVQLALNHFSQRLGMAVRMGGDSSKVFRDLIGGQSLSEFANGAKDTSAVLGEVIEAMNKMPDGPAKAALGMEVFGRSAREVLPVLLKIDDQGKKPVIDAETAEAAARFNEGLRELAESGHHLFEELAKDLLPTLNTVVEWVKEWSAQSSETGQIVHGLANFVRGLMVACSLLWEVLRSIATIIAGEVTAGFELLSNDFQGATRLAALWFDNLKAIWDLLKNLTGAFGSFGEVLNAVVHGEFGRAKELAKDIIAGMGQDTAAAFQRVSGNAQEAFKTWLETVKKNFQMVKEMGTGTLKELGDQWTAAANKWLDLFDERKGNKPGAERKSSAGGTKVPGGQLGGDQLARDIEKQYLAITEGRRAALSAERDSAMEKALGIVDEERQEEARAQIMEIYSRKEQAIVRETEDAKYHMRLQGLAEQLKLLEQDPSKTEAQKKPELLALLLEEAGIRKKLIDLKSDRINSPYLNEDEKRKEEAELQALKAEQLSGQQKINAVGAKGTFSGELSTALTSQMQSFGTLAANVATAITSTIGTAVSSVASGIAGWITGTKRWSDALREIGTGVLTTLVQGFVESAEKMVVNWIEQHVLMKAVSTLFRTTETTENIAHTQTNIGIHAAGETEKTGWTLGQSLIRRGVHLAETIFHGIQVAIRTAAHIVGEIAATAVSVAQQAIRVGLIIVEAIWWLIKAAFQGASAVANIPYVGPILAIAAIAAIIGVGAAAIAGAFQEGGFTGTGSDDEAAGIVHKNEYVFSAPRVREIGLSNLEALHQGGSLAAMSSARPRETNGTGSGRRLPIIHVNNFADMHEVTKHIRNNPDAHHAIVEVLRNHWHLISAR
jgi:hypothetical protein